MNEPNQQVDLDLAMPAPILSNIPDSFARSVFRDRNPAIIRQLAASLPYPPPIRRALQELSASVTGGKVEPLPPDAHDSDQWRKWGRDYFGQTWFDIPFLWAESYFYRKVLDAVDYFKPGPWLSIDPFGQQKSAELLDPALDVDLAGLAMLDSLSEAGQLTMAVDAALWGNRADLGFRLSDPESQHAKHAQDLVADGSGNLRRLLTTGTGTVICLVADNAGRELIPDLVLIDLLIRMGLADAVELHLKPHPYYVSDATTRDLIECLHRLGANKATAATAHRLTSAMSTGRISVHAHPFYCAPLTYHELPDDLGERFASAKLTILKGDLNYRRLVGDLQWPATTPFASSAKHFPGPVAALRTLKSDVIVGLTDDRLAVLDARNGAWRTSGTHGLIQVRK